MLILDFGLTLAIPSIVISALTGYSKDLNPNEYIHLTAEQASWLGNSFQAINSILTASLACAANCNFAFQFDLIWLMIDRQHFVCGSTGGELIVRSVVRTTWPQAINVHCKCAACNRMANAVYGHDKRSDFFGIRPARSGHRFDGGANHYVLGGDLVSMGCCCPLSESCVGNFVSNLDSFRFGRSEPSVRGILTACAGISATMGIFLVFLLGSFMAWRNVALVCAFVPAVTMIAVCFVSIGTSFLTGISLPPHKWTTSSSNFKFPGARDANLAPVQRAHRRRSQIAAMAPRLGLTESRRAWIRRFAALQKHLNRLRGMRKGKCPVSASSANAQRETARHLPQTHIKTVHNHHATILYHAILRHIRHASVHRTDSGGVRCADRCECHHRHSGTFRRFSEHCAVDYCATGWQTKHLFVFDGRDVFELLCAKYAASICCQLAICLTIIYLHFAGVYAYQYLPPGTSSFNEQTVENVNSTEISYYPMALFLIMQFCTSIGVSSVPNMLISEMFPFK